MLVLTRKPRQQIMVGDNIVINVVEVQGENVRIAIDAPKDIKIYRGEIYCTAWGFGSSWCVASEIKTPIRSGGKTSYYNRRFRVAYFKEDELKW